MRKQTNFKKWRDNLDTKMPTIAAITRSLEIKPLILAVIIGVQLANFDKKSKNWPLAQDKLRQFIKIVAVAESWNQDNYSLLQWWRWHSLTSFHSRTPEELFKSGHAGALLEYVEKVEAGVYT